MAGGGVSSAKDPLHTLQYSEEEIAAAVEEAEHWDTYIAVHVYNADAMPPYSLPDEKTKSTLKSNSSKGGGGFNEIRFEDKKGSEQLFIHAEKNQDIEVENDETH